MPLTPTNYLNSVIYKIEHESKPELLYIGSTTNFIKRKYSHKKGCNKEKDNAYNIKLYQMMRENGGFNEFKIMVIKNYPCNNKIELLIEEEKHRKEFKAILNTNKAYLTDDEKKEQNKQNKEYQKEYQAEYRQENKEEIKEYDKEYYEKNKEQIKEKSKEYKANNKEKIKKYYQDNKEKFNKKS
jgi:hypothetical protein